MERYICIHGHFYQPPREHPWLEEVEFQDSAYPYHDWNERITAECYEPNAACRILDADGRIVSIMNNYTKISFNFGPTLLAWLEKKSPEVYQAILQADQESQKIFSGHGSALAQSYNHIIMPLANTRDKYTQILWGIKDFEYRFGRFPEGMWLAETAVDLETLNIMAELGIKFTILAPNQAKRIRKIGDEEWSETKKAGLPVTIPYRQQLDNDRYIDIFFYDGPISRGVAFEHLLDSGEKFAHRLMDGFNGHSNGAQLVHIATDGETYGHHHRFGDMALAFALHYIESNNLAKVTNYGEYLANYPPTYEVEILEDTSWSCIHGIERWRSNCGCNSGGYAWNQLWRAPLRRAMDWLRDEMAPHFEEFGKQFLKDPWEARNDYISVVTNRDPENVKAFLSRHATHDLTPDEEILVLKLLESQRHAMFMTTSCGWFFDEISGIETVQVIQYAARALSLSEELYGVSFEPGFLDLLAEAKSNIPDHKDGNQIYEKWVKPSVVDLKKVAAHFALSSLFENYQKSDRLYSFKIDSEDYQLLPMGRAKMAIGRVKICSEITWESIKVSFGVFHLGDHNLSGGIREYGNEETYATLVRDITEVSMHGDVTELLRYIDKTFGTETYSLKLLFRDEQRKILNEVLDSNLSEAEANFRQLYEHNVLMMRFLSQLGNPLPKSFYIAAEFILNTDLKRAFQAQDFNAAYISTLLNEAKNLSVTIDNAGLNYTLKKTIEGLAKEFQANPNDLELLNKFEATVSLVDVLPFEVNLWKAQNTYFQVLQTNYAAIYRKAEEGDEDAAKWILTFSSLGDKLKVKVGESQMNQFRSILSTDSVVSELVKKKYIPRATYRLQFNRGFTFQDAKQLIGYLDDLGISDCYSSPLFKANPDSDHGYDVCDHSQLNPKLGSQEDFEAFSAELKAHKMGLILDMVPNHMGIGHDCNQWWLDVLENGPSSKYSGYFDIDWHPVKAELANKMLLPLLEDQYGKVLEDGKLKLSYREGGFYIYYYDMKFPVTPRSYSSILNFQLDRLTNQLGAESSDLQEYLSILTALTHLPESTELSPEKVQEQQREKEVIKRRLYNLYQNNDEVKVAIDQSVEIFNGSVGIPQSFDLLDQLISEQNYRLAFWRVASEEINYRRFFDINALAAIRVEVPEVYEATHQLIFKLISEEKITGLRIDHPDGLWHPNEYFRQLQESYLFHSATTKFTQGVPANLKANIANWVDNELQSSSPSWPFYVIAEKILSEDEPLSHAWAVHGTSGYDFLNAVNGLFVDQSKEKIFDKIYNDFIETPQNFARLVMDAKKSIMLISLAGEIHAISNQLDKITEKNRIYKDFTRDSLTSAIREVIACLPVYRTYISGPDTITDQDRFYIEIAVAKAKKQDPRTAETIFDFIRDTLLLHNLPNFRAEDRPMILNWVMKFQQITGPVMAKGVEDTAFYIYNRLTGLNEVGGNPAQFGISVDDFHKKNAERQRSWPQTMLDTSTHDTKRSEDLRARINVLSEIPKDWRTVLTRWRRLNAAHKTMINGEPAPSRNDEYLLYQTLLGAWPLEPFTSESLHNFRERIFSYMHKATKEAKVYTSWFNPNNEYDNAVRNFILRILSDDEENSFIKDFQAFQQKIAFYGQFNALSQALLKFTSPGVPDIYQGMELWNFSLVDPDNRRPVDFNRCHQLLSEMKDRIAHADQDLTGLTNELLNSSHDGRIKLYITYQTLNFRRDHKALFVEGDYLELAVNGSKAEHICAFARKLNDEIALVIVPRLLVHLTEEIEQLPVGKNIWQDTNIVLPFAKPDQKFRNIFTGKDVSVNTEQQILLADILAQFPLALMCA